MSQPTDFEAPNKRLRLDENRGNAAEAETEAEAEAEAEAKALTPNEI
jgi:hypothetical protein